MNKKIILSFFLALSACILTSCNFQNGGADYGALASKLNTKSITILTSSDWVKDAEKDMAEIFAAETGIEVNFETIVADKYQQELLERLGSGNCGDIFMAQSGFALESTYRVQDYAEDLSNEDWAKKYSVFSAEQTSVGGKLLGMTYYDTTTDYYIVYNSYLCKEVGVKKAPTTWEEFDALCEKLMAKGIIPIYEPVADGWHQTMLWADMGQVFDKLEPGLSARLNKNETTFSENENMRTALTQLASLAQKGYFGETYLTDTFEGATAALASGKYAMCMLKPGSISDIVNSPENSSFSESDFGLMLLPICDNQYLNVHPTGPSRFVYSKSENVEAAKLYLAYIAEKSNIQYMIDNDYSVDNLPFEAGQKAKYSSCTNKFIGSYDSEHSGMVLQDTVTYFNEQWGSISEDMKEMFVGNLSPEQLLKNVDANRAALAKQAGDPNWK